jgi:7,8-dihydropterin-6-yl-methyl-4-(beta-D-ribofuranosyl)aminobenzene 5'-phosphate synthase
MLPARLTGFGTLALAGLAARYAAGRIREDRAWLSVVESRLGDIGEVDQVSVLPLVERLTPDNAPPGGLRGEPGVSYLVRAGGTRLLFDTGLSGGRPRSALVANAERLGVDLSALDAVVISHLHEDHVGGVRSMARRTFTFAAEPIEPRGVPAYVPTEIHHDRAAVMRTTGPRVIAPGVAVLPPLPRMLFWAGPVAEQGLVINVRGFGLLLVTGCGHPRIEHILGVTEQVLDVPVRGIVGGLHLPVHPLGTPLIPQAVLGTPHWPWRPIGERDVEHVLDEIAARGPRLVALSSHDSTPWTYDAFAQRFGDRYRTLLVGEELRIGTDGVRAVPPGGPASVLA